LTCRVRRQGGNYVWLETALRGLYDKQAPSASHIIAVSRDVDARIRVTEALHRFQYVLDNTLDLIFIYDAESMRFTYVNSGAAQALGYSRSALLGMKPWQVRSGMSEAQYRAEMHPLLDGETHSRKIESSFRRADGEDLPVDATVQILRRPGERPTLICIARDATERQRIDRMKNEFVSTVSHELRTPLTSIRGSLGLIAGGATGPVSEQALSLVRIAHNNSERLMRLINDILDIEKMESGRMRFDMQPHGLRTVLLQSVDANRSYADQLGVEIAVEPGIPDVLIQADVDRFQQVMTNLLSNAAQFSPRGETIVVDARQTGEMVRISISDRGPGISEDFRSKIFGKFSQADSSDTRRKGGTGLGLSIVKAIVEEHTGSVWFDTKLGSGTTFHVTFPLAPAYGYEVAVQTAVSPLGAQANFS
jgi:PAS domain S-box-containing protein